MIHPNNGQVDSLPEAAPEIPIRVFLFVENRLLREALRRLFRKNADLQVVGEGGERNLSRQEIIDSRCDVLALDFFDPKWCPFHFVQVAPELCELKALLIGMDGDSTVFLEAVRAGVSGYLLKDASATGVIAAIRSVCKGQAVCPPKLCAALFQCVSQFPNQEQRHPLPLHPDLTLRQRRLVSLVARGMTNKEIAAHLNLSEFTVRNHVHRILKKTNVGKRRDAVDLVRAWSGGRENRHLALRY
jgi:DNA-binding NarL/FixJ family response regulator